MNDSWTVRVPASTSNLGPGFDFLGLALGLFLEVRAVPSDIPTHERVGGVEGVPVEEDLLVRAFERVRSVRPFEGRMRFEVRSEIPVGRGLGSSGAAIVAGALLAGAQATGAGGLRSEELLNLCVALEGHPDNVTASLFGGLTLCARTAPERWTAMAPQISSAIGFAVAWPGRGLETARSRAALPSEVPFEAAAENPRRLAFLLEGLRLGKREWIAFGGEERLHVQYRLPLLPGAERALAAARDAGAWMATLSGAGSGLVALGAHGEMEEVARVMAKELEDATGEGVGRVLEPVFGKAVVKRG